MNPTKDLTGLFNVAKEISIAIFQLNIQSIEVVNKVKTIAEHAVNDGSNDVREVMEVGLLSQFSDQTRTTGNR
jgi:hypothetical protein